MKKTEVEIKLRIEDPRAMAARLTGIGARLVHDREFEDNQLYDFPDFALKTRGAMLRLRTLPQNAFLTYKDTPRVERGAKVRDELETPVGESDTLSAIIAKIGLRPLFRYQKYRAVFAYSDLLITVDETPIGSYMELEGPQELIDEVATRLGYKASDYIVKSYLSLYQDHMRAKGQPLKDMLFEKADQP